MTAMLLLALGSFIASLLSTTALVVACLFSGGGPLAPTLPLPMLLLKSISTGRSSAIVDADDEVGRGTTLMLTSFRPDFVWSIGIEMVWPWSWTDLLKWLLSGFITSVKTFVLLGLGAFEGEENPFRGDACCFRGDFPGVLVVANEGSGSPRRLAIRDS